MRGIQMQRSHGSSAPKNRGIIRVRLDVAIDFLLGEPEIAPAPRIPALAELIARDLFRLPREANRAGPRLREALPAARPRPSNARVERKPRNPHSGLLSIAKPPAPEPDATQLRAPRPPSPNSRYSRRDSRRD